ncbi:MAG: hypothetical protein U0U46_12525 [Saprospiraceae bacterium]
MRYILLLCLFFLSSAPYAQKMLLIERANRAKTTKLFVGDELHFRLAGEEDYWYKRTITGILPESNMLLLDNFPVKLDSIVAIKVHRRPVWRILGATAIAFGASLAVATTAGAIYHDKDVKYGPLYATSAGSAGLGFFLSSKRKLKLGKKHRLRIIEIDFGPPLIPPPPGQNRQ